MCNVPLTPPPPFKVVPSSFECGLELLADLAKGRGGITITRSWTGQLSENKVHYSVFLQLVEVSLTVKMTVNTFCTEQLCWLFELSTLSGSIACIANVSARVRQERWDESKKKKESGGRGKGAKETLAANPTILKNCVRPQTQLLIGAVLVVLIK